MSSEIIREVPVPKGEKWHKLEEVIEQYKKAESESKKEVLKEQIKKMASEIISTAEKSDESLIKNLEEQLKDLGIE